MMENIKEQFARLYMELDLTDDQAAMIKKLQRDVDAALRQPPVIKSVCGDCIFYLTCKHESRDKQICVHFDDQP